VTAITEQNLTDVVLQRWRSIPDPRLRALMESFITHLHGFVRDVEPTEAEWGAAIGFLTQVGKKCDDKRQEFILLSDVLGVSMLVDAINHRSVGAATPSTVEGPFHVPNSPVYADGANMAAERPGIPCFVTGAAKGIDGKPIADAEIDLWQSDGEGLYEAQRNVAEPWMRGVFYTNADGSYSIRTVVPIPYSIPMDGPVGNLVRQARVSHMRPAHIHFCVEAPGYQSVVTHLFQNGGAFLDNDAVYAVKAPLIVEFVANPPGTAPNGEIVSTGYYTVNYDFVLQPKVL